MSTGTRAAVARATNAISWPGDASQVAPGGVLTDAAGAAHAQQIAALEQALLLLPGKANQSERNRLNKTLWALQQQQQPQLQPASSRTTRASSQHSTDQPPPVPMFTNAATAQLIEHWRALRPDGSPGVPSCVRCGDASAAVCVFHPDAKAWAFGSGRFDYAYTSLWDTPHDGWMCCANGTAAASGCVVEATHTADAGWWRAYAHLAPSMPGEHDDDSSEEGEEGMDRAAMAMEGMDIS